MPDMYETYRNNTKVCSNCCERKGKDEFRRREAAKDGLTPRCKACLSTQDGKKRLKLVEMHQLGVKKCRRCGELTPLAEMIKAKRNLMGVGSYCKRCHSSRCKARYLDRIIDPSSKVFQPEAFARLKLSTPEGRREFIAVCQFAPEMLTLEANRKLYERLQLEMLAESNCQPVPAETSEVAAANPIDTTINLE